MGVHSQAIPGSFGCALVGDQDEGAGQELVEGRVRRLLGGVDVLCQALLANALADISAIVAQPRGPH